MIRRKQEIYYLLLLYQCFFLNSIAYSLDILLDLKIVGVRIDLLYEQIFLLGYIISIRRLGSTTFLTVFLYLLLLSMLIIKNKWQAISSNLMEIPIKVLSVFALVILVYFLFRDEKQALGRLIGKK